MHRNIDDVAGIEISPGVIERVIIKQKVFEFID